MDLGAIALFFIKTNINNAFDELTLTSNLSFGDETADRQAFGSIDLPESGWHHIAVTFTPTNFKIYTDGNLKTNENIILSALPSTSTGLTLVGGRGLSTLFEGKIDDIKIYSRAFSSSEISDLYGTSNVAPILSNLTANDTYLIGSGGSTVSTTITDGTPPVTVNIQFKAITASVYTSLTLTSTDNTYTHTLVDADFDDLGTSFFFEAIDLALNKARSDTLIISTEIPANTETITELVPSLDQLDYSMIAMPYEKVLVSEIFSDLMPYVNTDWRLFHYNGTSTYAEYEKNFTFFEPGKGYWFLTTSAKNVNLGGGSAVRASENEPVKISLREGWNMIGNPYPFILDWNKVLIHNKAKGIITTELDNRNAQLSVFKNRAFTTTTQLNKFEGAVVNATTAVSNFEIPVTANGASGGRYSNDGKTEVFTQNPSDWLFELHVQNEELKSNVAAVGMHHQALDSIDFLDWIKFPRFSKYLDITFENQLSGSIKPNQGYYQWNFYVNNNFENRKTDLNWNQDFFQNTEYTLVMVDLLNHRKIDLSTTSRYSFIAASNAHEFALYYGKKDEILDKIISSANQVGEVYPNPFNQSIKIPFSLTKENNIINIKLIDLLGRTHMSKQVHYVENGYFEYMLDTNGSHNNLPEGTYILRVEIEVDNDFEIFNQKIIYQK